jgi:hypothetical protein
MIFSKKRHKTSPYLKRQCFVFISEKFSQIIFVPIGVLDKWRTCEIDSVISEDWPLQSEKIQENIIKTLNLFEENVREYDEGLDKWYSLKKSKTDGIRSFQKNYRTFHLETDTERKYEEGEKERIIIKTSVDEWGTEKYQLVGKGHLIGNDISNLIIEMQSACEKIKKTVPNKK